MDNVTVILDTKLTARVNTGLVAEFPTARTRRKLQTARARGVFVKMARTKGVVPPDTQYPP